MPKALAQKEGIFVGITAGATLAGALEVAKTAAPGSTMLAMLPDTGERYLSTPLFADVGDDMNEDGIEDFQFDAKPPHAAESGVVRSVILRCEPRKRRASKDDGVIGPSPFEGRASRGRLRVTEQPRGQPAWVSSPGSSSA